jgi:hypothetical protein
MNPKDKAKELFDKYYIICQEFTEEIQCSIQAKQCALIAVELALEYCNGKDMNEEFDKTLFLVKVKHEIEKL